MKSISNTSNWKLFKVIHFDLSFLLVNVYAPNSTIGKKVLWEVLDLIFEQLGVEKVVLVGYFNAILSLNEKKGGIIPPQKMMENFNIFVQKNALIDVQLVKGTYTWKNKM